MMDFLPHIPLTAETVLEFSCGDGDLGERFLKRKPNARYIGIEADKTLLTSATRRLSAALEGVIEDESLQDKLDKEIGEGELDVVIVRKGVSSQTSLDRLMSLLGNKLVPGGVLLLWIDNPHYWKNLKDWLEGKSFSLSRQVPLVPGDRLRRLFARAGFSLHDTSIDRVLKDYRQIAAELEPLAVRLGVDARRMQAALSTSGWLVTSVKGKPARKMSVAALGLAKVGGVTEARVDYPMEALNSLVDFQVIWGAGTLPLKGNTPPGILVLHRQFMNSADFNQRMETMVRNGWLLVADMDDDPRHWREYVESDFYAFRAVHAVTVSTPPLAELIRQWNPSVEIFGNAIFELPEVTPDVPKRAKLRIFFGALNRGDDWREIESGLIAAIELLGNAVEFVVVQDGEFYDKLPSEVAAEFHPLVSHDRYMNLLASCDISLMPLTDTPFNRLKSDLKFIESCAAGAVPICSPVVYDQVEAHRTIGLFASTASEWTEQLVAICKDFDEIMLRKKRGLEYVNGCRMHAHQVSARAEFYRKVLRSRNQLEAARRKRIDAL